MRSKTTIISTIFTFAVFMFGCSSTETANNSANTTETNANSSANSPLATTKTPEIATTNEAPTFSPLVKKYCEAILKKDDAGLRKLHSEETLKIYEADMKSENIASLSQFLAELDPIKDINKCGARNESIEGDEGVAEIRNENMPNGIKIEFVKEDGEWKLTNKSPDFNKVKDAATNSAK